MPSGFNVPYFRKLISLWSAWFLVVSQCAIKNFEWIGRKRPPPGITPMPCVGVWKPGRPLGECREAAICNLTWGAAEPRSISVAKRAARATSIRPEDDRASTPLWTLYVR